MSDSAVVYVPASQSREGFTRSVRAIKARMNAFTRGPLFMYSPLGTPSEQVEQVRALRSEIAAYDIAPQVAYMMRTSGSTSGTGKIVLLTTESLVASARATDEALGGPGRWTTCLSPAHIAGFHTIFRSVLNGFEPVWGGTGKLDDIRAALREYRPDERAYLSLVPTQLARLLDSAEGAELLARYDAVLVGGARTSDDILRRAENAGVRIVRTYGMTESCGGCVYDGTPIGDTRIHIDADGRIRLSGSCIAYGYAGSEPFDGEFATSDAGRMVGEHLEVIGRLDGAITTGGMTVIPELVEAELSRLGCGLSVLVGVSDDTWGQAIVALVEKNIPDIRERLAARLEKGWVPRRIFTLAELGLARIPLLESGKVDRKNVEAIVAYALANPACP